MSHSDQEIMDIFTQLICSCTAPIPDYKGIGCLRCGLVFQSKLRRAVCMCSDCKPFTNYQNIKVCEECKEIVLTEKNYDDYFNCLERYYKLVKF